MAKKGQTFQSYTEEFKLQAIHLYENGGMSYQAVAKELGIPSCTQVKVWVKKYRHAELEKTLQELYEDFQLDNRVKNLSEMTIRFYEQNLVHFFRFTEEIGIEYVREIEKKHVDKFIMWLKDKGLKDTTINTYLRATRAFLYFAMRKNYLIKFEINLIKADKQQKEPYTEEEIKKLIKKPNLRECGFVEHRNWVLVNYLLETGNRLNTVLNLKVGDIDLENGMVVLTTTKNRKAQYNPISENLVKILKEYIRMYRLKKDDYLFINELGEQMTRNAMQHAIARYNKKEVLKKLLFMPLDIHSPSTI